MDGSTAQRRDERRGGYRVSALLAHPLHRTLPASSRASLACLTPALCAVCVLPTNLWSASSHHMSSFVELLHRDSPGCVDVYQPAAEREGHFKGGRCFSVCAPSSEAPSVRKRCSRQHDGAAPNGAPAAPAGFQLLPQMVPGCTLRLAQHNLSTVDDFVNEQVQRLRQIQDWRDGRAVPAVARAAQSAVHATPMQTLLQV